MDNKHILIFDTTLRDGEQAPGFSMNISEKLEMAEMLESLGVDVIEAGFPVSSDDDRNAVTEIAKRVSCGVAALARAREEDILQAAKALEAAKKPRLHVFIATSKLHMEHKLHMNEQEILEAISRSVALARSLCPEVEFSCEDATRSDLDFLKIAARTAIEAGASVINLPDTVGYATPTETYGIYRSVMGDIDPDGRILFSTHCHNDLGMAVANSVAAVAAGARQVECTLCGIGERAGNASLEEVVMALRTRNDFYQAETGIHTRLLYPACRKLSSVLGISTPPNKPIIGVNAFAHEAGIHQHGMLANRATYEIISPEDVGIPKNDMVLGKHSGRHAFEQRLTELGIRMDKEELDEAFEMFKQVAERKKAVTDKDLHAIAGEKRRTIGKGFRLIRFIVNSGNTIPSMASVKLERDGKETEDSCMGSGPIDAAFKTVDRIVRHTKGYETLAYSLEDYSINSVTEGEDALGEVLIKLRCDGIVYTGRGLSTDILEASLKAYINGVNKLLTI